MPIHELGMDGNGRLFFTMKMVKGRSLSQVLDELRQSPQSADKDWPLGRMWPDIQLYYRSVQWAKHMCDHDPRVWTTPVRYGAIVPPV